MSTINTELQSLSPSALIELFEVDATAQGVASIYRFHAGTNKLTQPIVWKGVTYAPWPVEAEGFDVSGKGVLPRPTMRVANIDGLISADLMAHDDLIGAKVTRHRTFARFLDAMNFPGGVNPEADPNQAFPDDIWFIEQKALETRTVVEFELASAFDLQGCQLPARQVRQGSCGWKYRSAECGYTALVYFDRNDLATASATNDVCSKRIGGCKVRFGNNKLPFGGFPGAMRYE